MTEAWMAATPAQREAFDSEHEAEAWATEQIKSQRATEAVWWRVDVEGKR